MENKINRYVNKSFLIIDDFMEFKHSLKNMIETLGASNIDMAASGEEGIELYAQHHHDIVLLDYNLGEGLNGLQMLEELAIKDILRNDSIVILVTGETSMEMVQSAIDVRPDDYLPKPFTKAILKKRLDKAYERNEAVRPVSKALNQNDYLKAIGCCDHLIINRSKYSMACHRIKADCCLKLGKPNSAMAIYDSVLEKRDINWALLGRARCKVHCSMYPEAIIDLDRIIDSQRFAVEAYDQKAECLLAIGDYESAFKTIQKAVSISSHSVYRQRLLAQLATRYRHYDIAISARRKVINLSRHTSNRQPEDHLKLAQLLSIVHGGNYGAQSRRAPIELAKLLKDMQLVYQDDIQLSIAGLLHQGIYFTMSHKEQDGQVKINQAKEQLEALPDPLKPYLLEEIEFAYKICQDNPVIEKIYQDFYQVQQHDTNTTKANNYNRQGMAKFKARDYDAAYASFKTAFLNDKANINIALNLMQVIVKLIQQSNYKEEFKELLDSCAQTFRLITNSDQRATHFKALYTNIRNHVIKQTAARRSANG